jgi:uncharacterized protein YcfJ
MRSKLIASALVCSALAVAAAPVVADAATRHRVLVCGASKAHKNRGTAIGAVAGGLLGNTVAGHGNKTEGTILGAGVGALAGHEVAKGGAKRKCHYEYRYR